MTTPYVCPTCKAEIGLDDVNVAQDVALCRSCEKTYSFAEVTNEQQYPTFALEGTRYEETADGFVVEARTWSADVFLAAPMGILTFGLACLMYGSQIAKWQFIPPLSLLGIPVLLYSLGVFVWCLLCTVGTIRIQVIADNGVIFTGIESLGLKSRFSWSGVSSVTETTVLRNHKNIPAIRITGDRLIIFGTLLDRHRRRYLIGILRRELGKRGIVKPKIGHLDELLSA